MDNESVHQQAPLPLLPNFGVGRIRQYNPDIIAMQLMNGEGRTLARHTKLAEDAELQFVKLWDLGEMGVGV